MSKKNIYNRSGKFYFLVDCTDISNPLFSSVFHTVGQTKSNGEHHLQMLRDMDWSFRLPKTTLTHCLYEYTTNEVKSSWEHKCNIVNKFVNGNMDPFKLICQFTVDRDSTEFHNFTEKMQAISIENVKEQHHAIPMYQESIELHSESSEYDVKLTYDAIIYTEGSEILTMIALPNLIIKRL